MPLTMLEKQILYIKGIKQSKPTHLYPPPLRKILPLKAKYYCTRTTSFTLLRSVRLQRKTDCTPSLGIVVLRYVIPQVLINQLTERYGSINGVGSKPQVLLALLSNPAEVPPGRFHNKE